MRKGPLSKASISSVSQEILQSLWNSNLIIVFNTDRTHALITKTK